MADTPTPEKPDLANTSRAPRRPAIGPASTGPSGVAPSPAESGWLIWTMRVLIAAAVVLAVAMPRNSQFFLLLTLPIAVLHGVNRYGAKTMLVFFVVTFVVSNAFENLSITTGFPFGNYHYTGPFKLFHVPIQIGPFYFGLGYLSWQVANTLLDEADKRLGWRSGPAHRVNLVALPMIAAFLMTMTDLGRDSIASTVRKVWIWQDGGGVFGVPYTNYLGWWLVTYVFFQIFAVYLARRLTPVSTHGRESSLQVVIVYAAIGLTSISQFLVADGKDVTDGAGVVWNGHALNETMMTINLFTVLFASVFALIKLARNDAAEVRA